MQDTLAFVDVFTVPTDAGPNDDRIVIDGTTGRIEIYQGNTLVAFIDPDDGFVASDGTVPFTDGEYAQLDAGNGVVAVNNGHDTPGGMQASTSGPGDPSTLIDSPRNGVNITARITLKANGISGPSITLSTSTGAIAALLILNTTTIRIADGANRSMGQATLVAGTVTVSNTRVAANSRIFLSRHTAGGTLGHLSIGSISGATNFVINSSSATDTSVINWLIFDPQ